MLRLRIRRIICCWVYLFFTFYWHSNFSLHQQCMQDSLTSFANCQTSFADICIFVLDFSALHLTPLECVVDGGGLAHLTVLAVVLFLIAIPLR